MNANATANLVGITGIARRLVLDGHLAEADARKALDEATKAKTPVSRYLQDKKLATAAQIAGANAVEFGMPLFDASALDLNQAATKLVSEELINKHMALPLFKRGNRLFVGISDPTNTRALDEIKFAANLTVEPILVDEDRLRKTIDLALTASDSMGDAMDDAEGLENLESSSGDDDSSDNIADAKGGDDTPVVRFVNKVLLDSIKRGASDIHFEPYENEFRVRLRMDGILRTVAKAPVKLHQRITARLKVMASLDIAERRLPQDGRIKLNISKTRQMDFRVSTCPTLFGEKVVLRLLDGSAAKLGIDKLGYEDDQKQLYLEALAKPYGMILVTGPTGSGKTVSLYTGLNILNTEERNISTAEDPVEIRDLETAEIAIKAAQTGHLVLSTLHTNDAPQTVSRLMNMGIAPYNITSSVTVIIAQRLARRLHDCKKAVQLPENALLAEGFTPEEVKEGITLYEPVGCDDCNDGYKGRLGIYQVMPMAENIQKIILEGGNALQIAEAAEQAGVRDLRKSALWKAKQGVTSLAEVNRVTKD